MTISLSIINKMLNYRNPFQISSFLDIYTQIDIFNEDSRDSNFGIADDMVPFPVNMNYGCGFLRTGGRQGSAASHELGRKAYLYD